MCAVVEQIGFTPDPPKVLGPSQVVLAMRVLPKWTEVELVFSDLSSSDLNVEQSEEREDGLGQRQVWMFSAEPILFDVADDSTPDDQEDSINPGPAYGGQLVRHTTILPPVKKAEDKSHRVDSSEFHSHIANTEDEAGRSVTERHSSTPEEGVF